MSEEFNSISSDVLGLPDKTKENIYIEENDIIEINDSSYSIFNKQGNKITRNKHKFVPKSELAWVKLTMLDCLIFLSQQE